MAKKYQEVPLNFADIKDYLIHEKEEVVNSFLCGVNYFFYDTCSIQHHSNSENRGYIIEYLASKKATIILTRTVLMELSPNTSTIHRTQIQYFKELHNRGLKVLLFNEEYTFACLRECFNIPLAELNALLGFAVREISSYKTKIYEIMNAIDSRTAINIKGNRPERKELFSRFFTEARARKEEGDSLAEELMFICIIILTKIPSQSRFVFFSNDLSARAKVIALNEYIYRHHEKKEPYQLTTAAMVYKMFHNNILKNWDQLLEIMHKTYTSGRAKIFYVGEFDLKQQTGTYDSEEVVKRIVEDNEFKVIG